jgi:glycosyltransferase involved in cell wall biosynthesis
MTTNSTSSAAPSPPDVRKGTFVVIAAYNEASCIEEVAREVRAAYPNVVVVHDGSTNNTSEAPARGAAYVLRHVINRGQGAALQTGIEFALLPGARFIVTFDADGQHTQVRQKRAPACQMPPAGSYERMAVLRMAMPPRGIRQRPCYGGSNTRLESRRALRPRQGGYNNRGCRLGCVPRGNETKRVRRISMMRSKMRFRRLFRLRMVGRSRRPWIVLLVGLAVQFAGASAWAQRPVHQMPEEESSLLPWGIALGLAAIICLSAFLNPKRSHLT